MAGKATLVSIVESDAREKCRRRQGEIEASSSGRRKTSRLQNDLHVPGAIRGAQALEPVNTLGQRRDGADHRLHPDDPARNQVEAERVLACRGAGAEEADLAGDNRLQWKIRLSRQIADEHD